MFCISAFSKPFFICLPICCFYTLKKKIAQVSSLHFDVVGTGDLFFYVSPLVTRIFISKILGIKSSGYFYCDRLCNRLLSLLMGGSN